MSRETRKLDPLISCFVPRCKNKVLICPGKHFFYVPKSTRTQWCATVNKPNVPRNAAYICEDHLNLQEDVLNYNEWINKRVDRPRLKLQPPNTLKNIGTSSSPLPSTSATENEECDLSLPSYQEKGVLCIPQYHSKSVQVQPVMTNKSVSVSRRNFRKCNRFETTTEEYSEEHNPSTHGSTSYTESESSSVPPQAEKKFGRSFMLNLIEKNPIAYIGIPKQYYWVIQHIGREFKIPSLHIIITLYKLKNNDTFARMKDLFQISIATLWRTFHKTLKALCLFFNQFLYWPTKIDIKRNLPLVFTTNKEYASVQSIIDCFEIAIEKPKKPIEQSLTWSQYKNCNTIKYLIGATPDGFINFISEGYGGRITDIYLVEQSGFLETVPAHATILADRGFKHLESHLIKKSVKVLRPPSVFKDTKMTKSEVIDSKVLASLRIHIERVIRRVRLFKLLKPHSVVNNKLTSSLDDAVIVACGLINMQSPILKK